MARLFFALWPDTDTRHSLLKIRDTLPSDCGRLVATDNLHITLVFLGEVSTEKAECVINRVRHIRIKPATLFLDHIGWWKKTQVAWLAPTHIPGEIPILAAELAAAATQCTIKLDQRPYRPHVTLARGVRRNPRLSAVSPVQWPVRGYSLVQSQTCPAGSRYEEIWSSP
jgi:2'-5' RNA ligase